MKKHCTRKAEPLFSKDAICLVVWRGDKRPVIDVPDAKYGVKEFSNNYLEDK